MGDKEGDGLDSERVSFGQSCGTTTSITTGQSQSRNGIDIHIQSHEDKEEEGQKIVTDLGAELFGSGGCEEEEEKDEGLAYQLLDLTASNASRLSELRSIDKTQSKFWDNLPVERAIFKKHTRCFGLFFKTLHMERTFLDSHARLSKNMVYLGYFLVLVVSLIYGIQNYAQELYRQSECDTGKEAWCGTDRSKVFRVSFKSNFGFYFQYIFPFLLLMTLLGCLGHWFLHRTKRVKEKSWAMVSAFGVYLFYMVFMYVIIICTRRTIWPDSVMRWSILVFPVIVFFSGTPSFGPYFVIWLTCTIIFVVGYLVDYDNYNKKYGSASVDSRTLHYYFIYSFFWTVMVSLIYLLGSFLQEVGDRRQFLQRVLMNSQEEQIIREKTKNENLQRKLLENMLPTTIVDQLQQQNFKVNTWHQLRALSHRHLGVSILFAELENFKAFSSEVDPPRVMAYLNDLFLIFDNLCDQYEVYKVETVGDQYVAAVGVVTGDMLTEKPASTFKNKAPESSKTLDSFDGKDEEDGSSFNEASIKGASRSNTESMIGFGQAIIEGSRHVVIPETSARPLLRVGIHTGPCMSGIVGTRNFRFCLFGDTMNTAARMEQHGVPECIHVSQDVVDLAPEHSWEKRKKLNMKGKGSMQTYLLHISLLHCGIVGSQSSLTDDEKATHGIGHPLFMQEDDDVSLETAMKLMRLGSKNSDKDGNEDNEDRMPIDEEVFREHTVCLGLFFRKKHIEHAFLETQARQYEFIVYFGYCLYALLLLINLLYGYFSYKDQSEICENPDNRSFCVNMFGEGAWLDAQDPNKSFGYHDIINYSAFRMTMECGVIYVVLIIFGVASHYFIHRCRRVRNKSWALVNTWGIYIFNLVVADLVIMVFTRLPDDKSTQWPWSMTFVMLIQGTLYIFFSGATFTLYLLWWIIATALYCGLTIDRVLEDQKVIDAGNLQNFAPVLTTTQYIGWVVVILMYGIILVIGSYFKDVTSRRRFLQRILMHRQHGQIIKAKTKNEATQKTFLESILPSALVGELQMQQQDELSRKSFKKFQSLSQTHMGVSMLFADLVGFTAFSAQVDPFKVMVFLNDLFHVFDNMCDEYNVYKLETVGDCYVATVGVVTGMIVSSKLYGFEAQPNDSLVKQACTSNSKDLVGFAKAMIRGSRKVLKPVLKTPATMRVGIHTGNCMSGIIGTTKLKFCLLGDMVVTAASMEKLGTPDCIHASQEMVGFAPDEAWQEHEPLKSSVNELADTPKSYLLCLEA